MMIGDSTSRALNAINDLVDLLRLAHGAAERVEREVHGSDVYDYADQMSHAIREVRRTAEALRGTVETFVKDQASASIDV